MVPRRSVLAGFLLAPLISGVVHAAHTGSARWGALALVVAYPMSLLLGVPLVVLFTRRRWNRFWQAALAGAGAGCMTGAFVSFAIGQLNSQAVSAPLFSYLVTLCGFHGLAIAGLYWLLAMKCRREPGRADPG